MIDMILLIIAYYVKCGIFLFQKMENAKELIQMVNSLSISAVHANFVKEGEYIMNTDFYYRIQPKLESKPKGYCINCANYRPLLDSEATGICKNVFSDDYGYEVTIMHYCPNFHSKENNPTKTNSLTKTYIKFATEWQQVTHEILHKCGVK